MKRLNYFEAQEDTLSAILHWYDYYFCHLYVCTHVCTHVVRHSRDETTWKRSRQVVFSSKAEFVLIVHVYGCHSVGT